MIILTIFFFITAVLYSSIGFGGGSTYLALLLIWDVPYYIFPILALICNIIVVSGNSINFLKSKNINFNLLYPYLIGSIPLAFIGASISIDKNLFEILLFFILISAGVFLLLIGSIIGFMSGLVGIGGGIFLSPILYLLKAANPNHITTTVSLFILINSIFGIFGQITKDINLHEITNYLYLLIAVFVGGQIGNFLNIKIIPTRILALITSLLVIFVAARMGYNLI